MFTPTGAESSKIDLPVGAHFRYDERTGVRRVTLGHRPQLSLNVARDTRIMRFHANYVSTSVSGDYLQAVFEAEKDTDDPLSPYLLIQRQFEVPDDGTCYVETHDEKYIGHFLLRRVEFTPEGLSIEVDRPS